jgi:hypothetical protein
MPYPAKSRIPVVWADDVAPVVDAILKAGDKYHGKTVGLFYDSLAQDEMLAVWAKRMPSIRLLINLSLTQYRPGCERNFQTSHC